MAASAAAAARRRSGTRACRDELTGSYIWKRLLLHFFTFCTSKQISTRVCSITPNQSITNLCITVVTHDYQGMTYPTVNATTPGTFRGTTQHTKLLTMPTCCRKARSSRTFGHDMLARSTWTQASMLGLIDFRIEGLYVQVSSFGCGISLF